MRQDVKKWEVALPSCKIRIGPGIVVLQDRDYHVMGQDRD
jgi:hypothetical protein